MLLKGGPRFYKYVECFTIIHWKPCSNIRHQCYQQIFPSYCNYHMNHAVFLSVCYAVFGISPTGTQYMFHTIRTVIGMVGYISTLLPKCIINSWVMNNMKKNLQTTFQIISIGLCICKNLVPNWWQAIIWPNGNPFRWSINASRDLNEFDNIINKKIIVSVLSKRECYMKV